MTKYDINSSNELLPVGDPRIIRIDNGFRTLTPEQATEANLPPVGHPDIIVIGKSAILNEVGIGYN